MTHRVVEQRSARRAHNPEVAGSSPAHASQTQRELRRYPAAWSVTGLLGTPAPNRAAGTLSMPARPSRPRGVRSSKPWAVAGALPRPHAPNRLPGEACLEISRLGRGVAPTSLSARIARFSPSRVSAGTAFLFAPAPAGLSRDSSSFTTPQAAWAPRASARGFCS